MMHIIYGLVLMTTLCFTGCNCDKCGCCHHTKDTTTKIAQTPEQTQALITDITSQEIFNTTIKNTKPVIVKVFTTWCGACKHMEPIIKEIAQEHKDDYCFASLNAEIENVKAVSAKLNVSGYPTFVIYKDGKEVGRIEGGRSKEAFVQELQQIITTK